jgi:DNA helicase HerA-like ATPase
MSTAPRPIDSDSINLPGDTDRLAVLGRTGSGKTQAAVYHLSRAGFDYMPWVIVDYKNDELINRIDRAETIDFGTVPDEPGIYILKVLPGQEDQLSEWFRGAWEQEDIGIYVDEGYLVDPRDRWFNACLTQGRSKHIPMIVLSQRPVWLSRYVFSEASYFQVFDLSHTKDMEKIREYVRDDDSQQLEQPLADFHSYYYDVARRRLYTLGPAPEADVLLRRIDERLAAIQAHQVLEDGQPVRRTRAL